MENNAESVSQPYGDEAKFFTESRLLQRDVEVILESVNNANFVGSIIHPVSSLAISKRD
jgi:staphylococcal nuclease domain-containing protein 1